MCELCDIQKDIDEKNSEMEFRFIQYQVELRAGRHKEAEKAKKRAEELMVSIFDNLDRFITLQKTDLGELLRGKLN